MSYSSYAKKWNSKRSSSKHLAHDLLEKPAMYDLLPNLQGKKVLCIGSGSGEECKIMQQKGAIEILGIDSSKGLIEESKRNYPNIQFELMNAEHLNLTQNSFDFAYSSLTLHYLANWPEFFGRLKKVLIPNSQFLFSIHHPIKWGAKSVRNSQFNQFVMGYKKYKTNSDLKSRSSQKYEIYGNYLDFYKAKDTLFGELKIEYYHRSFSTIFREINSSGFQIEQFLEPLPLVQSQKSHPDFFAVYSKIPLFAIFLVRSV